MLVVAFGFRLRRPDQPHRKVVAVSGAGGSVFEAFERAQEEAKRAHPGWQVADCLESILDFEKVPL